MPAARPLRTIRLRHHGVLAPVFGFDRLVSVSVGPAGEAVVLWSDRAGEAALVPAEEAPGADETGPMEGPAAAVAVAVQRPTVTRAVRVPEFTGTSPLAQPLPDGRVLITGTWAQWRPGHPDLNATIYGDDGTPQLSACLGDGIQQVAATADGAVWVAYHDMGIYGNNGWGGPGPDPIGCAGLVRFSADLEVEWEFPGDHPPQGTDRELGPIDECESITLSGETLWTCYYAEFRVVRVDDGRVRSWAPGSPDALADAAAQAVVTDGRRVALVGGWPGNHDRAVVAHLDESWVVEGVRRLVLPDGAPLPADVQVRGSADTLHVFAGRDWYTVTIEEL
jgi:hypothetical protein